MISLRNVRFGYGSRSTSLVCESLDIPAGVTLLLGPNGAGKSTLLKLLTGTTQPTEGSMHIEGRVAALLELGLGFHPDFTGRQNAVMAGQLMGLSARDVTALMPEIEQFAEVGAYFDQPLRTYSTGMGVRLAFSVATAARPDVLILDETLSVGDAYFGHKCMRRIREFRAAGTTLLLVSHDPIAVKTLCDRALLLERGQVVRDGAPDTVLEANGYRLRVWPETLDEARSDAEGRFLLTPQTAGPYYVRAEASTGAPAELGPIEVDERLGGAPLELNLGLGGAIEGRVREGEGTSFGLSVKPRFSYDPPRVGYVPW